MLIDHHKLHFHPERVSQWRESKTWEQAKSLYPIYVEVSPVGACNHRCTFCAVDYIGYKAVQWGGSLLRERLREMGSLGVKSVMFAGEGEPLLHKQINSIVLAAKFAGIDTSFTTNGVLLDKLEVLSDVSWIKVSVNAGTRETYSKVHRTKEDDWNKVWSAIERAVQRKGKCTIGVQMVVLPENEHEWRHLYEMASSRGVDYVVLKPYSQHKFSVTHEYENYRNPLLCNILDKPTKLYVRDDAPSHEPHQYEKCNATPNFWAYLMANGDLYSCSAYLLDPRFNLGSLKDKTFKEVWEGEKRRENWEFVRNDLNISECRKNCRMDKANRYLWAFDRTEHVNFI